MSWRKKEGEAVRKGEVLLEIETDKATVEVEATESGILGKILCGEGMTVPVLIPIAILAGPGEDISGAVEEARGEMRSMLTGNAAVAEALGLTGNDARKSMGSDAQSVHPRSERSVPHAEGIKASPAAKKIARDRGIDLSRSMSGSGPGGRILSSDVEKVPIAPADGPRRRPLAGMRRAIAKNLLLSKQTIPHFYMRLTIDAAPLVDFYRSQKALYPCTMNDVIVLACSRLIKDYPAFRSRIDGDEVVELPAASIGIAVGMEDGLRVPVLVDAGRLSLKELGRESKRIVDAAQQGKLEGVGQGVFTVTNLGMFGVEEFSAIINPPEAAILAVGAVREDVVVREGALRPGRVMTLTLSADHRIIDGLMAAKFMSRLKEILEAPGVLGS